eukprot:CAMPEP_0181338978 /NCGR_PEP_ID=MMETSP1101-20121128/28962_1 /TAXON_ID=46948 /ORGANISM="Rhodomonas abbreviata, Strain Caron Lab Isolate" /LENGTH=72 /DNA_ID=CAMNT_0023449819 /DNA_START=226 /DNA_END=441 /DNA_ORIENTATION=-
MYTGIQHPLDRRREPHGDVSEEPLLMLFDVPSSCRSEGKQRGGKEPYSKDSLRPRQQQLPPDQRRGLKPKKG